MSVYCRLWPGNEKLTGMGWGMTDEESCRDLLTPEYRGDSPTVQVAARIVPDLGGC